MTFEPQHAALCIERNTPGRSAMETALNIEHSAFSVHWIASARSLEHGTLGHIRYLGRCIRRWATEQLASYGKGAKTSLDIN